MLLRDNMQFDLLMCSNQYKYQAQPGQLPPSQLETLLPVAMTSIRLGAVFAATLAMASFSALLSLGGLRRADPADMF
jgi:hypothetical protein